MLNAVATWFFSNSTPLGDPGKIDEATFGKRKFNRGAYREGVYVWVVLIGELGTAHFQRMYSQLHCPFNVVGMH